jgi:hypothetical protein
MKDFQPGDRIIFTLKNGEERTYTVLDRPYTSRGKVRMQGPQGGYGTAWWTPDSCGSPGSTFRIEHAATD